MPQADSVYPELTARENLHFHGALYMTDMKSVASRIDEILATGLHAFLTQFLDRVNTLGGHISRDFLVAAD